MARAAPLAAALAVAVYLALAAPILDAPLRWDETEFPRQASAIVQRGVPKVTFAETGYVVHPDAWVRQWDADYGLWHPPLYLYLLAAPVAVFGEGDVAVRSLGFVLGAAGTLLTVLVTWLLATRAGLRAPAAVAAAAIAGLAMATNPFWVEGTMRIDIDGALGSLLVLGTAAGYGILAARRAPLRGPFLGAMLFALLWAKPPSVPLILAGLLLYALACARRELLVVVVAAAVAAAAFAVTWGAYCVGLGLPWDFPLKFTGAKGENIGRSPFDIANVIRFNLAWIGFPLVALGLVATLATLRRVLRRRPEPLPHDALVLIALVTAAFYLLVWTQPGKYTVLLVPLLSVAGAIEAVPVLAAVRLRGRGGPALAGLAAVTFFLGALLVRDTVTAPERLATERGFSAALDDPRLPRLAVAGGLLLVAIIGARLVGARGASAAVVVGSLVVLLPLQVTQIVRLGANADSTLVLAPKEEAGFRDTVGWLREHVRSGDILIAPKELAYYLDRGKVVPTDRDITYPIDEVPAAVVGGRARYVVADGQGLATITLAEPDWRDGFVQRRRLGSFEVYERIRTSPTTEEASA